MPAVVDPARCNRNWDQCFSAKVCPENALSFDEASGVVIDWTLCGDCPGPCVNFCDGYAIMYDRDPDTFDIMRRQVGQELSEEEAVQAKRDLGDAAAERQARESAVTEVTIDNFREEVLQSTVAVVVDFWAPWCGPCKAMAPVFEDVASEYGPRVKFVKINTEDEQQLAAQFRISSIPTLLVFQGGQLVDGTVGALSRSQLVDLVDRVAAPVIDADFTVAESDE